MGIDISWEDENGRQIQFVVDKKDELSRLLSQEITPKSSLINYIDPYGDTIFNQIQIPTLIKELEDFVKENNKDVELAAALNLVKASKGKTHTYIKFIGD